MTKPGSLRDEMPHNTVVIDACREAFGVPEINKSIRAGMDGSGTFYASENGREIGSKPLPPGASFTVDQLNLSPAKTNRRKN
jgi:hypothetical protein